MPGLCGDDDELLTPSAWCTIERSSFLLADPAELITPDAWSAELVSCRTLLVPEPELVTPDEWL